MSKKPWEVWDEWHDYQGSFRTLAAAEKSARRHVAQHGERLEIWHDSPERIVAYVRPDALGRVWTDVVDCAVA